MDPQSIPAQDGAEDLVEGWEIEVVWYGQNPDHIGLTL
jgi:hypothetical protein